MRFKCFLNGHRRPSQTQRSEVFVCQTQCKTHTRVRECNTARKRKAANQYGAIGVPPRNAALRSVQSAPLECPPLECPHALNNTRLRQVV